MIHVFRTHYQSCDPSLVILDFLGTPRFTIRNNHSYRIGCPQWDSPHGAPGRAPVRSIPKKVLANLRTFCGQKRGPATFLFKTNRVEGMSRKVYYVWGLYIYIFIYFVNTVYTYLKQYIYIYNPIQHIHIIYNNMYTYHRHIHTPGFGLCHTTGPQTNSKKTCIITRIGVFNGQ